MNYNFENIAGYETEKEELKRLCEIFNNRQKYEKKGAKLPKGIIFYGEAGTGKTLFSKVLASVCDLEVFKIDLGDVENESSICRHIKKTFLKASKRKNPTMIFFDEVDKVLPNDDEEYYTDRSKTILTQLLTLIDGMDSCGNVVFVATCNNYDALPTTLTRPGRIDKKIGLGKPTYSSRVAILKMYSQKSSCKFEVSMEDLAKLCSGFSCAAIETMINECVLHSDDSGLVSESLIHEKIFEIKDEDIKKERSSIEDSITACFKVGTFIVAKSLNSSHYVLSLDQRSVGNDFFDHILSDFDDDDYDDDYDDDDEENDDFDIEEEDLHITEYYEENSGFSQNTFCKYYSKVDLTNTITVLLGGYVAEEIVFGKVYNNVSNFLEVANDILYKMAKNGMFGFNLSFSSYRHESILPYSEDFLKRINDAFEKTLLSCYEKAKSIILKNESVLKNLIPFLVEQQFVQEECCEEFLASLGGIKS